MEALWGKVNFGHLVLTDFASDVIAAASPVQAPPPATALVVAGTKSEREIELERKLDAQTERAKKAEVIAAEWQRENEGLKTLPRTPAPKPKRKHNWLSPVIGAGDDE